MDRSLLGRIFCAFVMLSFLAVPVLAEATNPVETTCDSGNKVVDLACQVKNTVIALGPLVSIVLIVLAGITFAIARFGLPAETRGRYENLAVAMFIGGIICAVVVGGAGVIYDVFSQLLVPG